MAGTPLSCTTLETPSGKMAPPKSGHPLGMPPESGGIPGRVHFWEVPFALMLSPGWPRQIPGPDHPALVLFGWLVEGGPNPFLYCTRAAAGRYDAG